MNSERNIITFLDKWDARVGSWLDEKYPTAIYRFTAGMSWAGVLLGIYAIVRAHFTGGIFDLILGLLLLVGWSSVSALVTVWAHNEIANLRRKSRKYHPSFPY